MRTRSVFWCAAVFCLLGGALRLHFAREAALWGDEFHSLRAWRSGLAELLASYDRYGSGLALPLLQRLTADALGETVLAVRLPALAGGLSGLALLWPFARRSAGPGAAALATLGLALSPLHLFYSHFGRSYSLVVALALLLADGIQRLAARPTSRAAAAEIGVAAALLPWVHLASAAVVAAGALGAAVACPRAGRRPLAAALALATLACVVSYLPAREALLGFVGAKAGRGETVPFGPLDVAAIATGSRTTGAIWLLAVPVASLAWLRQRGAAGAPLLALALLPLAALAWVDPTSNAFAFARYLIGSLPFVIVLLAWAALRAGDALAGRVGRAAAAVATACLFAAGAAGPLAAAHRDGPFANTYLGLHPVAAFDAAPPATHDFYAGLAARPELAEVVEVPPVRMADAMLYRGAARLHGRPVRFGYFAAPPARVRGAAYADLDALGPCRGTRVVVAHRDLASELRAYFPFVATRLRERDAAVGGPLLRQVVVEQHIAPDAIGELIARFGTPFHEDARLLAWDVPCPARTD